MIRSCRAMGRQKGGPRRADADVRSLLCPLATSHGKRLSAPLSKGHQVACALSAPSLLLSHQMKGALKIPHHAPTQTIHVSRKPSDSRSLTGLRRSMRDAHAQIILQRKQVQRPCPRAIF